MNNFRCSLKFNSNIINLTNAFPRATSNIYVRSFSASVKLPSAKAEEYDNIINITGCDYIRDSNTNVTPRILNYIDRKLYLRRNHPLNLVKQRLVNFIYGKYVNRRGNPLFSVYDKFSPVVTIEQNFDSLLIAPNHPSRSKTDTYYINSKYVLRTHTSAHQKELILSGLDNFLVIGDVFRRDEINDKHFPVFHQAEAVRLFSSQELFHSSSSSDGLKLFENDVRKPDKQECHSLETVKLVEHDLKLCLTGLVQRLFGSGKQSIWISCNVVIAVFIIIAGLVILICKGQHYKHNKDVKLKWTDSYFPFTHPSWEMEVFFEGQWMEILGCGIVEQEILRKSGAGDKVGWAFGVGLERLAMMLYDIPDIRLFWSQDSGFLSQFNVRDPEAPIKFTAVSKYPQCINDISFWVPENFHPHDFYDVARSVGGEVIEQVHKIDEFFHPKKNRKSFCFRIVYRHMDRTLTQDEVSKIHKEIENVASKDLKVEIR